MTANKQSTTYSSNQPLHTRNLCEFVNGNLQTELDRHLPEDPLVIIEEDPDLNPLVPIDNNSSIIASDTRLTFPDNARIYTAPTRSPYSNHNERLPVSSDERFHFEPNSTDFLLALFGATGYIERFAPYMDFTRIVKPGGTILTATGLQPGKSPYHDAKFWFPQSQDAEIESIRILRSEEMQTPITITEAEVTTEHVRNNAATIVTGNQATEEVVTDDMQHSTSNECPAKRTTSDDRTDTTHTLKEWSQ